MATKLNISRGKKSQSTCLPVIWKYRQWPTCRWFITVYQFCTVVKTGDLSIPINNSPHIDVTIVSVPVHFAKIFVDSLLVARFTMTRSAAVELRQCPCHVPHSKLASLLNRRFLDNLMCTPQAFGFWLTSKMSALWSIRQAHLWLKCRMSKPDRISTESQVECQRKYVRCQKGFQIGCQNRCQIERQNRMSE